MTSENTTDPETVPEITTLDQALAELGLVLLTNGDIGLNLSRIDQIDPETGHTAENKVRTFHVVDLAEINELLESIPVVIKTVRKFYPEAEANEVIKGQERVQQAYLVAREYLLSRPV